MKWDACQSEIPFLFPYLTSTVRCFCLLGDARPMVIPWCQNNSLQDSFFWFELSHQLTSDREAHVGGEMPCYTTFHLRASIEVFFLPICLLLLLRQSHFHVALAVTQRGRWRNSVLLINNLSSICVQRAIFFLYVKVLIWFLSFFFSRQNKNTCKNYLCAKLIPWWEQNKTHSL